MKTELLNQSFSRRPT